MEVADSLSKEKMFQKNSTLIMPLSSSSSISSASSNISSASQLRTHITKAQKRANNDHYVSGNNSDIGSSAAGKEEAALLLEAVMTLNNIAAKKVDNIIFNIKINCFIFLYLF